LIVIIRCQTSTSLSGSNPLRAKPPATWTSAARRSPELRRISLVSAPTEEGSARSHANENARERIGPIARLVGAAIDEKQRGPTFGERSRNGLTDLAFTSGASQQHWIAEIAL
jgi:hypothetical protein